MKKENFSFFENIKIYFCLYLFAKFLFKYFLFLLRNRLINKIKYRL